MDDRRRIPRTDAVLADPRLAAAAATHGRPRVKAAVVAAQERARSGDLDPERVPDAALAALRPPSSLRPVLNATGIVVHTNLGRAPLSAAAIAAVVDAAGAVDLEFDLATGRRGRRGAGVEAALLGAVPNAEAALGVNNGAAALLLATTGLAAGREVVVSRGELVEIGAGFRLPDLVASTGARLREVGTTNRTHLADYADAVGPDTGCILKVHPSNFRVEGFTSGVGVAELAALTRPDGTSVPVVVDIGSGLLAPDPLLPGEPDAASVMAAGATVVTASGDKLLGGPQAGLLLGTADAIDRLRRHPLARALRVDKLALAALEATLNGPTPPVTAHRRLRPDDYRARTEALAVRVGGAVTPVEGRVGGGGAPGVPLPGLAVALPTEAAHPDRVAASLRTGDPPVVARVEGGTCLVDLRCIDPADDDRVAAAVLAALVSAAHAEGRP
ncbi:L-seryl-tRNA(Sec) selenium transferase [Propioniciclava sinopodophylli]|uniref:L-seryl-tRNA(Sec) selenium transferase n=1 Tax=Propioniciclava sinopodophylli TaxID=1837344 RepID=UPI0024907772|nr:L-seryl-tRNA(Sec) selenium transferase [Propioniciclava sinopodophylli]